MKLWHAYSLNSMIARIAPKCPKCGESYNGIYKDQSNVPIMHRIIGDTFIRWDRDDHRCRLGIKYFIERADLNLWFYLGRKSNWTNDPMLAKMFDTRGQADQYLKETTIISARLDCLVTEHEFVTPTEQTK